MTAPGTEEDRGAADGGADLDVWYEVAWAPALRPSPAAHVNPVDPTGGPSTTRRAVGPQDLDALGALLGRSVLAWVDEAATTRVVALVGHGRVVTKLVSEIDFVGSAGRGDLVEVQMEVAALGRTSVTLRAQVRNATAPAPILTVERLVLVSLDEDGRPAPHGVARTAPADPR